MNFLATIEGRSTRVPKHGMIAPGVFKAGQEGRCDCTCVFVSREAYNRYVELTERAERVVTEFSMWSFRGACTTYWYIRGQEILGRWRSFKTLYTPDLTFEEQEIKDLAAEWAWVRQTEKRRHAPQDDESTEPGFVQHPRNAGTTINLDFRPDTYWPFSAPSPRRDDKTLLPFPNPAPKRVAPESTGPGNEAEPERMDLLPGEVEIARLTRLHADGDDVVSVCARVDQNRIHYRVLSERSTLKGIPCAPATSLRPLSLAELIDLIANSRDTRLGRPGLYFGHLLRRDDFFHTTESAAAQRGVITVSSSFYPMLAPWYAEAFEEWCDPEGANRPKVSDEDDDGDEDLGEEEDDA